MPVGELFENEHVHCFVGEFDRTIDTNQFNRDEVSEVKWMSIDDIVEQMRVQPEVFTEWFKIYMTQHRELLGLH